MRVAITGSTGLIGRSLAASLSSDGHVVVPVVRTPPRSTEIGWDIAEQRLDAGDLEGLDAVVHLAGEPIGARRWSRAVRAEIRDSRVHGTQLLARAIASLAQPPALLSASAVGFYGDRGADVVDESGQAGADFLASVCLAWEEATKPASTAGARVCLLRNGVVMAADGALMQKVRRPFALGVGGRIGNGRQYVPWIALADQVAAIRFLLEQAALDGPFNLVGPEPATNAELTRALGTAMRRPTVLPIPLVALRLLYGEMGVALAGTSQRVVPRRLVDAGFRFSVPSIDAAVREALA